MWWPGDEGGEATTDILQGRISSRGTPAVHLAQRLQDYPATDPRFPERGLQGEWWKSPTRRASMSVIVGSIGRALLRSIPWVTVVLHTVRVFPSEYRASRRWRAGRQIRCAQYRPHESDEVPQVYLGAPSAPPQDARFAIRALAGFDRIHLRPAERRTVCIHIRPRSLQYWSEQTASWKRPDGTRDLFVGSSSADLRLQQRVR